MSGSQITCEEVNSRPQETPGVSAVTSACVQKARSLQGLQMLRDEALDEIGKQH